MVTSPPRVQPRRSLLVLAALCALPVGLLAGCSGTSGADPSSSPTGQAAPSATADPPATPAPAVEDDPDLLAYRAALSQEQNAVRAALAPDQLAAMSSEQVEKAFSVFLPEVAAPDGSLDLAKYAVAVTTRLEALNNAGCAEGEWAKFGGPDEVVSGDYVTISDFYGPAATRGLYARASTRDLAPALARCNTVLYLQSTGEALAPYQISYWIKPGSVEVDGPRAVNFVIRIEDNWDVQAARDAGYGGERQTATMWLSLSSIVVDETTGRMAPGVVTSNP